MFFTRCGGTDFRSRQRFGESDRSRLRKISIELRLSLQIAGRKQRGFVYRQCFTGTAAVSHLVAKVGCDRAEGTRTCQDLVEGGFIHHVKNQHDFLDTKSFFRFYVDEAATPGGNWSGSGSLSRFYEAESEARQRVVGTNSLAYELRRAVPIHDRRAGGGRLFRNCFLGCDAVSWMVRIGVACTREDAVEQGRRLLTVNIIHHCKAQHGFLDTKSFYRFAVDAERGGSQHGLLSKASTTQLLRAPRAGELSDFAASGGDGEGFTSDATIPAGALGSPPMSASQQWRFGAHVKANSTAMDVALGDDIEAAFHSGDRAETERHMARLRERVMLQVASEESDWRVVRSAPLKQRRVNLETNISRSLSGGSSSDDGAVSTAMGATYNPRARGGGAYVRAGATYLPVPMVRLRSVPADCACAHRLLRRDGAVNVLRKGGDKGYIHPCLRASGIVRTSATDFVDTFLDFETRSRWEPHFLVGRVVEDLTEAVADPQQHAPSAVPSTGDAASTGRSGGGAPGGGGGTTSGGEGATGGGEETASLAGGGESGNSSGDGGGTPPTSCTRIIYRRTKAPTERFRPVTLCSDRDVCSLQDYSVAEDGTHLIIEISVKHADVPELEDSVRAEVFIVAYAVRQLPSAQAPTPAASPVSRPGATVVGDAASNGGDGERSHVTLLRQFDQRGLAKTWGWLTGGHGARDKRGARAAEKLEWLRLGAETSAMHLGRTRSLNSAAAAASSVTRSSSTPSLSAASSPKLRLSDFE